MTDDRSPAQYASQTAEAIRSLNHAPLNYPILSPSDAYRATLKLADMARRLPQALDQIRGHVNALEAAGYTPTPSPWHAIS
ncbi:hypothetical protein ACFQ61_09535 [Streptomyces sp. NPDC056500]|uniref:hypothetical protein n=1 Tax=Streptomyces sp. NPDC056500 TaxID=3345840 RepID=UPI0036CA45AF